MAILSEFSSASLVLFVSVVLVLVSLEQVQTKTNELKVGLKKPNGRYAPDAKTESEYIKIIQNALKGDKAAKEFQRLAWKWGDKINESFTDEKVDAKFDWFNNMLNKNRSKELENTQQLKVALTYLFYYRTKGLLDEGDVSGALSTLQTLKSMRKTWPGIHKTAIDLLESQVIRKAQMKSGESLLY